MFGFFKRNKKQKTNKDLIDERGNIIMDFSIFDAKRAGFDKVVFVIKKEIEKLNLNASKPIEFGILNDSQIYMLLTWIKGESAEEIIPTLTNKNAYDLGVKAGVMMKQLHQISIEK